MDIANNNIGSSGVKLLVKASFNKLDTIYLCNIVIMKASCNIGEEGVKYLSKAKW